MISWILGVGLLIWCIKKRMDPDGKVEGEPLGMPRGTVRALITIMVVAFPFNYLITEQEIPAYITSSIFILVAFYFEARKGGQDRINRIFQHIKNFKKAEQTEKKSWKPLYLPKYSVRILLIVILALMVLINTFGPNVPIQATNTLAEIFLIIFLFWIGTLIRIIGQNREKKKINTEIESMENFRNMSKYEIFEKLVEEKPSWWKRTGNSIFSVFTLIIVIIALFMYTIDWNPLSIAITVFPLTIRQIMLLFVNVYYGLRD